MSLSVFPLPNTPQGQAGHMVTYFFSLLLVTSTFGMIFLSLLLVLDRARLFLAGGDLLLDRLSLSLDRDLEFLKCLELCLARLLDEDLDLDLPDLLLDHAGDFERDFDFDLDLAFGFGLGLSLDLELELELDLEVFGDL